MVLIAAKTSGDSGPGVSHDIFGPIQDSFTTQGFRPEMAPGGHKVGFSLGCEAPAPAALKPHPVKRVKVVYGRNFNALRAFQQ